jgi:hypothetical protein
VTTTLPFAAPPLLVAVPASTVRSCTSPPHPRAMLAVSVLKV